MCLLFFRSIKKELLLGQTRTRISGSWRHLCYSATLSFSLMWKYWDMFCSTFVLSPLIFIDKTIWRNPSFCSRSTQTTPLIFDFLKIRRVFYPCFYAFFRGRFALHGWMVRIGPRSVRGARIMTPSLIYKTLKIRGGGIINAPRTKYGTEP